MRKTRICLLCGEEVSCPTEDFPRFCPGCRGELSLVKKEDLLSKGKKPCKNAEDCKKCGTMFPHINCLEDPK